MGNAYQSRLASGGGVAPTGDAVVADVLAGKTFSNANAVGLEGTMVNNGAVSGTATPSTPYTIPEGYHNGLGTVTASAIGDLLPNNGDYMLGNDRVVTIGQYTTGTIGPASAGSPAADGFCLINVTNYTTATCPSSWALSAFGIKNGVVSAITPSGQTADITNYDYFVWMTANRQMSFT